MFPLVKNDEGADPNLSANKDADENLEEGEHNSEKSK